MHIKFLYAEFVVRNKKVLYTIKNSRPIGRDLLARIVINQNLYIYGKDAEWHVLPSSRGVTEIFLQLYLWKNPSWRGVTPL